MKIYELKIETTLPTTLDKAWDFFTSPNNLAQITPPDMGFIVTSNSPADAKVYAGMVITYKVSPLFGIKLNWMTEITHVKEKEYFVDEQRFGPFSLWHHEHHFREEKGNVVMTDILHYAIPFGFIGRIANSLLVGKRVKQIFAYREKVIKKLFVK